MTRHVAAIAAVLCLSPSWLHAQDVVFTVKVSSATVHVSPSTGSPVIGRAQRGTPLEVTKELGSWIKVSWPGALEGAGFVHVSMGSISRKPLTTSTTVGEAPAARRSSGPPAVPLAEHQPVPVETGRGVGYVVPPAHVFGFGGTMGGTTFGLGGSARLWSRNGLGVEVGASRHVFTSTNTPGRVTSIQFAPSVLFALPDHLTDYVRLRPFVGAGIPFHRQSLSIPPIEGTLVSDSGFGFRAFAGTEVTLASVPRLALSVDAGYQKSPEPFIGFEPRRFAVTVSGHWYVR